jgi:hypothetical protein
LYCLASSQQQLQEATAAKLQQWQRQLRLQHSSSSSRLRVNQCWQVSR